MTPQPPPDAPQLHSAWRPIEQADKRKEYIVADNLGQVFSRAQWSKADRQWNFFARDNSWYRIECPEWFFEVPPAPKSYIEAVKSSPAVPVKAGEERPTCPGCNQPIDPDTCGCGGPIKGHSMYENHPPIPMGCDCHRYKEEPPVTDPQRETPRTDAESYMTSRGPVVRADFARTLERELEFTRAAVSSWKRAFIRVKAREDGETHFWQGDGEDHLESLGCPILISPEQLRGIFDELAAAKQDSERLRAAIIEAVENGHKYGTAMTTSLRDMLSGALNSENTMGKVMAHLATLTKGDLLARIEEHQNAMADSERLEWALENVSLIFEPEGMNGWRNLNTRAEIDDAMREGEG